MDTDWTNPLRVDRVHGNVDTMSALGDAIQHSLSILDLRAGAQSATGGPNSVA